MLIKLKKLVINEYFFFLSCLSCYLQEGTGVKLSPKKGTAEKSLGTADLDSHLAMIFI
jgi:hypothetical protein